MQIYSFNAQPRNMWDNINTRNYNGKSSVDYIKELADSFSPVNIGIDNSMEIYDIPQQQSINQVIGAKSEWEAASDILSGKRNGSFIGFDLETLGYTGSESPSGLSLITEFGMGKRNYVNGELVSSNHISFAMGANLEQTHQLQEIVNKFERQGYDALDNAERVTVDRLSMIGHGKHNFHDVFGMDDSTGMYVIRQIGEKSRSTSDMRHGIGLLNHLYRNGATPETYLPKILDMFESQAKDSVIFGANSQFDYSMIQRITGRDFSEYFDKTVDVTNGVRISAAAESSSVLSYMHNLTGRLPESNYDTAASMDNLPGFFGLNTKQLHTAGKDVFNEGEILSYRTFSKTADGTPRNFADTVLQAIDSDITTSRSVDLDSSVLFFNRGGMNISKSDFATINGKAIPQSYGMANDYWRVDTSLTGTYTRKLPGEESAEKFIAVFKNAADEDIVIRREYDSIEKFYDDIRKNTNQIPLEDITKKQINDQHKLAMLDRGRREYVKGINPYDVRMDNQDDAYGIYKLLKDKDKLDIIKKDERYTGNLELNKGLLDIVESHKDELDLHSPYQIQAFAGAAERLHYESGLIDYISDGIDKAYGSDLDNLSKSIIFDDVYSNIYEAISNSERYLSPEQMAKQKPEYNISDVYGIDIQTKDGIKRINAQTEESARIDVNRIFSKMTNEEATEALKDLAERKVISPEVKDKLLSSFNLTYKPNEGIYNFTVDAATEFTKIVDIFKKQYAKSDKLISEFQAVKAMDPEHTAPEGIAIQNKNLRSVSTEQSFSARGLIYDTQKDEKRHFGALFGSGTKESQEEFKTIVDASISKAVNETKVPLTGKSESNLVNDLVKSLNLQTDNQIEILQQMFGTEKDYGLARKELGMQHFVITPREGTNDSAFVIVTNDKHVNAVQNILMKQQSEIENAVSNEHLNTYQELRNMFDNDAAIIELRHVNTYDLNNELYSDDAFSLLNSTRTIKETDNTIKLTSISQGRIEKFSTPSIQIWEKDGVISAKVGDNVEDFLSAYRMKAVNDFIPRLADSDFSGASASIRRAQNNVLSKLSSPSSYRGHVLPDGTVVRKANFHPADYINAYEIDIKGVIDLFDAMSTESISGREGETNAVQNLLARFNEENNIVYGLDNPTKSKKMYRDIANSSQFSEHFAKNIFLGEGSENILDAMIDTAKNNSARYNGTVLSMLENLKSLSSEVNQILPDSATKHKDSRYMISLRMPGEFSNLQGFFSTMRPTYYQQNRPIYFKEEDFKLLTKGEKGFLADGYSRIGQTSYSSLEYKILGNQSVEEKIKSITTRFKQVNDADLYEIYKNAGDNVKDITQAVNEIVNKERKLKNKKAANISIKEDAIARGIEYINAEMANVYEGKWYVDPLLAQTSLFTDIDSKHISPFNINNINEKATYNYLNSRKESIIEAGQKIGVSINGKDIIYDGPKFKLTENIIDELVSYGSSDVVPVQSAISDIKLMIGSEKGTAHSISIEKFMKYTGIKSETRAVQVAHGIFQELFGANVIGNIGATKHNNNFASWSEWNIIATQFKAADRLPGLLALTRDIKEFDDWHLQIKNNELVMDTSHAKDAVTAVKKLQDRLRNDSANRTDTLGKLYSDTLSQIQYAKDNHIIYGEVQRVHMNEHLSNMFKMDKRIEQGVRLRNQDFYNLDDAYDADGKPIEYRTADDKYLDAYKAKAMSESIGEADVKLDADLIQAFSDYESVNNPAVANARKYNKAAQSRENDVAGIIQARDFLLTGEKPENIITITPDDLIDANGNRIIPKNATAEDLRKFIFDVDGEHSEFIEMLRGKQNVALDKNSYSVYFDFGETVKLSLGKDANGNTLTTKVNGVVIPRLNVLTTTSGSDEYFVNSQKTVTSLMNSIMDYLDKKEGHKDLKSILENYGAQLIKDTQIMSKDSDLYKAVGRWAMPNAGQFLSQDETAALVSDMFKDGLYEKYKQQQLIGDQIAKGDYSLIDKYNELGVEIKNGLSKVADAIENEENELPEFLAIQARQKIADKTKDVFTPKKFSSIIEVNGKQTYNNAVAIGEESFRELGFSFEKAGMDLLSAQQNNRKALIPGMAEGQFVVSQKQINNIVNNINKTKLITLDANDKDIIGTLNAELKKKYGLDPDTAFTIKDINRQLTEKQRSEINDIFSAFSSLGKKYAAEIGVFGEHLRYPSFVGQPAVNVKLDSSIQGKQIRLLNPLFSLFTNVDFDGDTEFLSLLLNGNSISTYENKAFQNLYTSWQQGMSNNRKLVADMIRDGEAFKKDILTDYQLSYSNMLKSFKEDKFWDAVNEFVDSEMPAYKGLTNAEKEANEGLMIAAMHSKEMASAWEKYGINTLTDTQVKLASMIPNLRKLNIGMYSTPNYNLRDVLTEIRNSKVYSKETRQEAIDILSDITNMKIKNHGLTGKTEQKGIDVKHLIDATHVANTPKWSIGMSQIFKTNGSDKDKFQGLVNLIEGSYNVLFKGYVDKNGNAVDPKVIAEEIINTTRQQFKDLGDDDITVAKRWLRGVYDTSLIDGAEELYSTVLKKGSPWNIVIDDVINKDSKTYGTLLSSANDLLEKIQGAVDLKYIDDNNHVYIKPGDIFGNTRDELLTINRITGDFAQLDKINVVEKTDVSGKVIKDIEREKHYESLRAGTTAQANRELDKLFGNRRGFVPENITIHDVTESSNAYKLAVKNSSLKKMDTTIETILSIDGLKQYNTFLQMNPIQQANYGQEQYNIVKSLFGSTSEEAQQQLQRVHELESAYKYYTSERSGGVKPLISELNKDIINNPEKYANTTFSDAFEKQVLAQMGNDNVALESALKDSKEFGGIIDQYYSAISSLNEGLYDTISEEKRLNKNFDIIAGYQKRYENIDDIKDIMKPLNDRITNRQSIINDTISELKNKNRITINKVQDKVYSLFKDEQQMFDFFKFSQHGIDTKVGFGSYMGIKFGDLSYKDISNIYSEAESVINATGFHKNAVSQTIDALRSFEKDNKGSILQGNNGTARKLLSSSLDVDSIIVENGNIIQTLSENYGKLDSKIRNKVEEQAQKNAKNNMKKRMLDSEAFSGVKDLAKKYITPRNVGIAVAGMAALGITNNLLHKQRNQSPLAPQQTGSTSPSIAGNNPSVELPPQQAPASKGPLQRRTVYHDNPSGLNFRVSARTKHNMDARQTASLVNNMGGGQVNYSVSQDTSGVSDNWLANKFAELA